MKRKLLSIALFLGFFSSFSQITTSDSTFSSGDIPTEISFLNIDTSFESSCPDTLVVQIPSGNYVYWVDVEYDMTAASQAWMSEQVSYVECVSTGNKESQVYQGAGLGGTFSYSRNNLNIADGISSTGTLKFVLHAFREWGGTGCNTTFNKVDNNSWTITVHHGPAPTCFQPTNLNVNWVMSDKAEVSWTTGGATNWQIEYGTSGFTLGNGTLLSATSNPFVISGLSASTSYDFYVRDSCGTGNVSVWSVVDSFTTLCAPVSLPYSENFDGTSWTAGTGGSNANDGIPTCWSRDPEGNTGGFGGDYFVGVRSGATGTPNTGPSGDHTTGSAKYVYGETSLGGYPDQAVLLSPLINSSSLTLPEISFWYHMYGNSTGTLYLDIWNKTSGWSNAWSITGQQQNSSTASWTQAKVTLSNYVGDTIRYRIRMLRSFNAQGDMAVDDVSIQEAPTCPDPSNLVVQSFTVSSVTLDWTVVNATSWDIQYGATGFSLGSGTLQNVSSHPATITGLTANTTYDFYVREKCSATDTSNWIGPVTATTLCNPVAAPYSEDFDSSPWVAGTGVYSTGATLENCWIRVPDNGVSGSSPYFWSVRSGGTSTPGTGPNGDNGGTGNYIYTESSAGTPNQEAEIYLPPINLTSLTTPELRFWYHMFGATMGTLYVDVQSASGTWTNSVWTISSQQQSSNAAAYTEAVVDISSFAGDTIVVRLRGKRGSANTGDIAVDDITIDEAPTCPDPSNLASGGVTNTTILLNWTTGGASDWNVAYGTTGFTPGSTFNSTSTNPYTLTGLSPSTTYDIYVRDSCGMGDVSSWIGPITVTTLCNVVSAPFSENFDGTSWIENGTFTPGVIDVCWLRSDTTAYWWKPGTGPSPSNNTGPSGDNTSGSGKYLYTETFNTGGGLTSTEIQTPLIDLSSLTIPELTFYYHMYGQLIYSLEVEVWDGSSWNTETTISGQQQSGSSVSWTQQIVDISAYAGDTIIVRFKGTRNPGANNQVDIAIDDVSINEQPACPQPSNLTSTSSTANSVTLSWTTGGATNWQIEYGPVGFASGNGTIVNATTNPFTVTGLSGSTTYDFYVRDSCGAASTSAWVGPISENTLCVVASAPFSENFDFGFDEGIGAQNAGSAIGACWTRTPTSGYHWGGGTGTTPTGGTGPSADHTSGSGNYVYSEASAGGGGGGGGNPPTAELESPEIELSSLTNPQLSFWYHVNGLNIGDFDVEIYDGSTWTNELNIGTSQGNNWLEATISLTSYSSDTIKVRFTATRGTGGQAFSGDLAIDDFLIDEAPSCPKPDSLMVVSTSTNSAILSWTTGGATNWNIEYGPVGFTLGSGTVVNAATNPFTVTGLSASTSYDFYVRDSCGAGDVSTWLGPISGTTLCGVVTAPYLENFDGAVWDPGTGGFAAGVIDSCWLRNSSANYWWRPGTGGTPTANTGPSADHTSGNGKFIYTESQQNSTTTSIESPEVDISGLTSPELRFWYHMYGALIDSLSVSIFDGSSWNYAISYAGAQQTSNADSWLESVVDLSAYSGDTIKLRFTGYKTAGFTNTADISIDDVSIDEVPTCPKPTLVSLNNVTSTTATLSWTTGGATNWNIEYGPVGFTPGNGTYVATTTNPFTVTGLSASTSYDFYVRDSCGTGDVSAWVGPILGTTLCGLYTAPFAENFDGSVWDPGTGGFASGTIDSCWSRSATANYWFRPGQGTTPTGNTGPTGDHTSGSGGFIYTESFQGLSTTDIQSPDIDISGLTSPELRFWYHMYGSLIDSMAVHIFDGSSWTYALSYVGAQQTSSADAWKEAVVDLSSFSGDTIRLRFTGYRTAGGINTADISIDDVTVDEVPSCPKPTNLASTGSTTTSVTLSWTTGGATNWQIEYGPVGFAIGSGTVVTAATNPYTVTGLSPSQTYDFYVRDSCGANDVSVWVGPLATGTQCGTVVAPYFENFDIDFDEGTGVLNDGSTISACWTRNPDSAYHWGGGTGPTGTGLTGPPADHTTGFGNYVYTEASLTPAGSVAELETPNIDLSNLTSPELKFWYHMNGNNMGTLRIDIYNGTSWTNGIDSIVGSQGNNWLEYVYSLSSYSNNTIKVRFRSKKATGANGQSGDIAIDDLSIDEAPTCPDPSNLSSLAISMTSIQLSWTTGGATNWQIEYGATGFTPGSGTIVTANTNPYVVTGLTANTTYDFYLRDSCAANDFSNWIGPISETTLSCANGCTYVLELSDTFGDGWTSNGAGTNFHYLDVTIGTNTMSYTMSNGTFVSYNLNVCDGDTIILEFDNNGNWSDECGIELIDGSGTTVYTKASGNNIPTGFLWSGSIMCSSPCPPPVASFTTVLNNLQANFDGSGSTGTGLTYDWDFGDGNNGTGATTSNTYSVAGTYTVTLIVTDACGQTDTVSQTYSIGTPCPTPIPAFTYTETFLSVDFDASSSTGATLQYDWDYGDGNLGSGVSPSHVYAMDGNYSVKLVITDACGVSDSTTQNIQVCDSLVANFTMNQAGLNINVDGSSSSAGAVQWDWDFGDGNTASGMTASYTYAATGTYQVTLTVTNICGETATFVSLVTVCVKPYATWSYTIVSSGGSGMVVQFNGSNSTGGNSYFWDFGDGNTNNSSAIPTHTYAVPGLFYVVTLIVTNPCGDSDTLKASLAQISIPEDELITNINVYPNPSSGDLNIQFERKMDLETEVEFYDISGRLINTYKAELQDSDAIHLDISYYPPGEYLLLMRTNVGYLKKKIIVQ